MSISVSMAWHKIVTASVRGESHYYFKKCRREIVRYVTIMYNTNISKLLTVKSILKSKPLKHVAGTKVFLIALLIVSQYSDLSHDL